MIRTQIYLTNPIYQGIKLLAQRENRPVAEIIRTLLEAGLKKESKKNSAQALLRIADNAIHTDIKDLSTNLNKYLYE